MHDSAGVRIIDYASMPATHEHWAVSAEPDVVIGSVEGKGADVFTAVQAVVRRSDGVLVVADGGTDELRAFDSNGQHLWTTGRRGSGPGEFRSISALFVMPDDSVLAFDRALGRLSVFGPSGEFVRAFRVRTPDPGDELVRILGVTGGGSVVGYGRSEAGPIPKNGVYRRAGRVAWYDSEGIMLSKTDTTFGSGFSVHTFPDGHYESGAFGLERRTEAAVRGTQVDVSTEIHFVIQGYDERGGLQRILRVKTRPTVVDATVRREIYPKGRGVSWMFPDTLPALGEVRLDSNGRLWVEDFMSRYERPAERWWVFDPQDRLVADATIPKDLTVEQIEADEIVDVKQDSLGVSYVQVRRIKR